MARKAQYAVYVADANGWDEGCQDAEGVFFGSDHGGQFYRHPWEVPTAAVDLGTMGVVVVTGHRGASERRFSR